MFRKYSEFCKLEWNIERNRLCKGNIKRKIDIIECESGGKRKLKLKFMFRLTFQKAMLKIAIQYYKINSDTCKNSKDVKNIISHFKHWLLQIFFLWFTI